MYTIQHNPARLFICNEIGITIVHHKHTKVLGLKGKRQISSVQSSDRGSLLTVVTFMSPTGHFIPPLLIFPSKYPYLVLLVFHRLLLLKLSEQQISLCQAWTYSQILVVEQQMK
jgi:hypothetical protein